MHKKILQFLVGALFNIIITYSTASYAAEALEVSAEKVVLGTGASVNERILSVQGDPDRPARLVVTVLTPDGPGPFPLAVMNHGAAGSTRTDLEPRYWNTLSAYYFLSRGYAVALPMMPCRKASQECLVYAADNDVTWVKQMPIPPATNFAALDDVNAVPYLNDKGRQSYQAFLKKKNPRVFAIAPNGAAVSTQGGYDPLARALNICKSHGLACRPYAVNDQVVWTEMKKIAAH